MTPIIVEEMDIHPDDHAQMRQLKNQTNVFRRLMNNINQRRQRKSNLPSSLLELKLESNRISFEAYKPIWAL
jgi:hypothetical protein